MYCFIYLEIICNSLGYALDFINLLICRDGVSESQFEQVLSDEYLAFKKVKIIYCLQNEEKKAYDVLSSFVISNRI